MQSNEQPRLRRGETVGRYLVVDLVGRGAMGEVYKAHDTALDRMVALKVLTIAPGDRQLEEDIAVREGQMLARVRHPGVVAVFDVGVHPPSTFIALEFVEGTSLREAIGQGTLEVGAVRILAQQLAEGLAAIHEAGLVHRDIKPGNILIDRAGVARLADLGVAKLAIDMAPDPAESGSTWVGTPGYRAPEVEAGAVASQAADVYSLCASLSEAVPTSSAGRALRRVLARGLESEPGRRPTAHALARALAPKPKTSWWLAAAAATTAAAVVGFWPGEVAPTIDPIAAAEERLAPVWNPEVAERLRAWAETGTAEGEGWTRREVARGLQRRASEWVHAAAEVDALGDAAQTLLHRRCLSAVMTHIDGAVEMTLARVGSAQPLLGWIHELPTARGCLSSEAQRDRFAGWDDAGSAQRIADLERLLRADGAIRLGDLDEARKAIEASTGRVDLGVLDGYLAYLQGLLEVKANGAPRAAAERYRAAILAADAHGDRLLAARSALELSRMLVVDGSYDEARFVVERATADLGLEPGSELLALQLLGALTNIEGELGTDASRARLRQRLAELEPAIDRDGVEGFYWHSAWANLVPAESEEHELAAWQLASAHYGPTHEMAVNREERYIRKACERWSATTCSREYAEFREHNRGLGIQSSPAVVMVTETFALSQAGHHFAAWERRSDIEAALRNTDQPMEKLLCALTLAGLASVESMAGADERTRLAESAVEVVASLGAAEHLAGARMLAAITAASVGDRRLARAHLRAIEDHRLLHAFTRARIDLAFGDDARALADLEALAPEAESAKNNLWVEVRQVKQALCVASFRVGTAAQIEQHCTRAVEEPRLAEADREIASAMLALGLATAEHDS